MNRQAWPWLVRRLVLGQDDGKTLHLVFCGDDYFAVRRAALKLDSLP